MAVQPTGPTKLGKRIVMEEDKEKMFCAEFNDYLAKPLDEKTLINMVKKHQKESI